MNHKKKVIDAVLSDPLYKTVAKNLPPEQQEKITRVLEGFVDNFTVNLLRAFTAAAAAGNQKPSGIPSGSVLRENG
jgi:hypothetical protein